MVDDFGVASSAGSCDAEKDGVFVLVHALRWGFAVMTGYELEAMLRYAQASVCHDPITVGLCRLLGLGVCGAVGGGQAV